VLQGFVNNPNHMHISRTTTPSSTGFPLLPYFPGIGAPATAPGGVKTMANRSECRVRFKILSPPEGWIELALCR
jgi:hypothetical protein